MKKLAAMILAFATIAFADEGRPVYNPFSSFGLEISAIRPINEIWQDSRSAFGSVGFVANFQVLPYTSVTGDAGYSFPGNGFDVKVGFQQMLLPVDISPFIGGMAGVQAVPAGNDIDTFGDRFGPTLEASAGFFFFRESRFSLRLKGSYQWIFAKNVDHGFGISVAILFANTAPGLKAIDVSK